MTGSTEPAGAPAGPVAPPVRRAAPYRRPKQTKRSVILADRTADWTIRTGGVAVIVAVFGIMVFLAEVVVPLLTGARFEGSAIAALGGEDTLERQLILTATDDNLTLAATVDDSGRIAAIHLASGHRIEATPFDLGGRRATATAHTPIGARLAFGFDDGSVAFGALTFKTELLEAEDLPTGLMELEKSNELTDGGAVYAPIATGQYRKTTIAATLGEPAPVTPGQAIRAIDYRVGGPAERPTRAFVTLDDAGVARLTLAETRKNMMTGRERTTLSNSELPGFVSEGRIVATLINEKADQVYIAEASGTVRRYDARDRAQPVLAETADLAPGAAELTAISFLIGEESLAVGRSDGTVAIYVRLPRDGGGIDGYAMTETKTLAPHAAAVVAIAPAQRGKMFATVSAEGDVHLRHGTSAQLLLQLQPEDEAARPGILAFAPRDNAILGVGGGRLASWRFDAPHPETTMETIFGKVWYEGYPEPTYTWQSSAGSDAFEPKFSLIPLIFGTLKATLYSLLFAAPIALSAAIYTSEFLRPEARAVIKPTMELMASLPSVVLGFIAAIILAPIVETWITAVIVAPIAIATGLMLAACLWQIAPRALGNNGILRVAAMSAAMAAAALLCVGFAPTIERWLFAGDFKAWSAGAVGSDTPLTTILLWPAMFVVLWLVSGRLFGARFDRTMRGAGAPGVYLARWLATAALAAALALMLAVAIDAAGTSIRGGAIGGFVQRNTLIVAFAMGFAVIPIIYTVSEDALGAVPEHLRAASLALGATRWQTTIGVVAPAAMSGIFAAIMIGMGRAVGETMIVVMAAGNTPIIDWNVFAGLRALSANIAVELPEAVRDSTLYRMLFLAALTLFVMTFVVNTVAELVRLRFRKRTASL